MTRFDAAEPTERRALYADAITAHRTRGSGFTTLEVDDEVFEAGTDDGGGGDATDPDADQPPDSDLGTPWIQVADDTINLDCTDDEFESLTSLLEEYPSFTIDEIHRPDDVDGINVRVRARADPDRIAQCLDAIVRRVYGLPADVRVWVVDV